MAITSGDCRPTLWSTRWTRALPTFFTADSHFGHGGALGLFRRPFASVVVMDEALVAAWNMVVGPGDTVWHLGDFAVRSQARTTA